MPNPDVDHLGHLAALAAAEAAGEHVVIALGPAAAFMLVAAVQLACRHPEMSPEQRGTLRGLCDQLGPLFAGTPVEALLAAGWDAERDVPL